MEINIVIVVITMAKCSNDEKSILGFSSPLIVIWHIFNVGTKKESVYFIAKRESLINRYPCQSI